MPEHYALINARYHWIHREQRNAKNRAYYRKNRERLIVYSLERRKKFRSLDYGWANDLANDRVQFDIHSMARAEQSTQEYVSDLMDRLSSTERAWCEQFMNKGTSIPESVLKSIRSKLLI